MWFACLPFLPMLVVLAYAAGVTLVRVLNELASLAAEEHGTAIAKSDSPSSVLRETLARWLANFGDSALTRSRWQSAALWPAATQVVLNAWFLLLEHHGAVVPTLTRAGLLCGLLMLPISLRWRRRTLPVP